MKSLALIACAALMSAATVAAAAETGQPAGRETAVMLYFSKSFGSDQKQNRSPLAFGLRLQQSSPFDVTQSIAVFDARYSLGGRKTLAFAGLNAFESTSGSSQESSGESSASSDTVLQDHPYLTGAAVALAVLGIMCATRNLVCEKKGYGGPPSDTPQPGN